MAQTEMRLVATLVRQLIVDWVMGSQLTENDDGTIEIEGEKIDKGISAGLVVYLILLYSV